MTPLPVTLAPHVNGQWVAVGLLGVAAAGHHGCRTSPFTLTSDLFPRKAVGSVVGIGGLAGAMGGCFMNLGAGLIKQHTGSHATTFALAGVTYPLALLGG